MYPSEYQNEQHRQDMLKAAEHRTLVKLATEGSSNFLQRVVERLPIIEITAPTVRLVAKQPANAVA
jgi:hypothetical protein